MDVTHLGGRHYLTLIDYGPSRFARRTCYNSKKEGRKQGNKEGENQEREKEGRKENEGESEREGTANEREGETVRLNMPWN